MSMRSMWHGAISFGMVTVPVRLYKAQDEGSGVSFRTLCPDCQQPIKQLQHCPTTGEPVQGDTLKGYPVSKTAFVVVDEQDLDGLELASLQTITLQRFVTPPGRSAVGLYARGAYFLEPDDVGRRAYALLRQALEQTGRWGVGKIALRGREHLCAIQPHGDGLMLVILAWPEDVRSQAELKLPHGELPLSDAETALAVTLIENLAGPFNPAEFRDEYREAVTRMVESKLGNLGPVHATAAPAKTIEDLLTSLKASVEAARAA